MAELDTLLYDILFRDSKFTPCYDSNKVLISYDNSVQSLRGAF